MTSGGWKKIFSGCNIRDFGQLLNSLHPQLWHLLYKHEKATEKLNCKLLSVIFKKIYLQYVYVYTHTHTHIYTYIYIYI